MLNDRVVRVQASVDVDASVSHTWAVVTDWSSQGDWIPFTTVAIDPGSPTGLGARLVARTGVGPAAIVDPMEVDVWEPPHRCEVVHHGQVVTGRGVFLVDALPGSRSRFTWQEIPDSHGMRAMLERLGSPLSRWALGIATRRLARLAAASR
jgi:hypothetical protein